MLSFKCSKAEKGETVVRNANAFMEQPPTTVIPALMRVVEMVKNIVNDRLKKNKKLQNTKNNAKKNSHQKVR